MVDPKTGKKWTMICFVNKTKLKRHHQHQIRCDFVFFSSISVFCFDDIFFYSNQMLTICKRGNRLIC